MNREILYLQVHQTDVCPQFPDDIEWWDSFTDPNCRVCGYRLTPNQTLFWLHQRLATIEEKDKP